MQNLNQLLELLLEADLDFLVVGGFAAVIHGSSHVTKDLDISMVMSPKSIETLRTALKDLEPTHRMNPAQKISFIESPKDLENINNLYLETSAGILDVVSLSPDLGSFEELMSRALSVELFGYECKVISLDDLIEIKESMIRPKDKIVLEELKQIKELSKL